MAVLLYIGLIVFIVAYVVLLPQMQGVMKIKRSTRSKKSSKGETLDQDQGISSSSYSGYVPPSDSYLESKVDKKSRRAALKEKLNEQSLPIDYELGIGSELRKRNKNVKVEDMAQTKNPDSYDYDLDELIQEENEQDRRDAEISFNKHIDLNNREKV